MPLGVVHYVFDLVGYYAQNVVVVHSLLWSLISVVTMTLIIFAIAFWTIVLFSYHVQPALLHALLVLL